MRPWLRSAGAASALALAAGAGLVSYERTRGELLALEVCEAMARGDVAAALAASTDATPAGAAGRALSACRCRAEIASGRGEACDARLAGWLARPMNASELPPPDLAARWIASRRAAGHTREAAEFARRAGAVYPGDAEVFAQELATRASVEDEASVLRELAARIPAEGEPAARMRIALAQRHLRSGDGAAAREVLGDTPPPGAGDALGPWFDSRAVAAAFSDDLAGVRRAFEAWRAAGGDPVELRARYALTLSIAGLADPEREPAALLRASLDETKDRASEGLRRALAIRLVLTLANAGQQGEALALYDVEQALLAPTGVSRAEIARAARMQDLAGATAAQRAGTLAFRVAGARPDDVLWISPDADAEPDAPYQSIAVPADGRVEVARAEGVSPQRYVLHDAAGGVRASGTVSPVAGTRAQVEVVAREAAKAAAPRRRTRAPGDGKRRVALVLFDCADWRITSYLRRRGELPQLDALLRDGYRAVLDSDPPLTAAAIESLVWPERESGVSLAGLVHRMGVELAGLESIGRNPFEALGWVMPESTDLFATLGAGELRAANLLFAHGSIRAGRNGEVTGPRGARTLLSLGRVERDLESQERLRFPELAALGDERDAHLVHAIAAEMDAATRLAGQRDLAFFALRVEPLDILTHAHFAEAVADGQDDGAGLLFSVYRYLDHRLIEVDAALDADDVLIAMSDHGIRTAMEHSRDALFVAAGGGVPVGRAPGRPALRGVARASADWLGVATQWPQTGVAPFASGGSALAASEQRSDSPVRR